MSIHNKPKINKADYMFQNKSNEELVKLPGAINGMMFKIKELHNCTVFLYDHISQVSFFDTFFPKNFLTKLFFVQNRSQSTSVQTRSFTLDPANSPFLLEIALIVRWLWRVPNSGAGTFITLRFSFSSQTSLSWNLLIIWHSRLTTGSTQSRMNISKLLS